MAWLRSLRTYVMDDAMNNVMNGTVDDVVYDAMDGVLDDLMMRLVT